MDRLPFTGPWLLAPMEGVTDPAFRDLVLACNPADRLGGAFTEFVRVSGAALPRRVLREHLGPRRFEAPVGLQIMGSEPELVGQTARRAFEVGAPLVDLNFGCPAKGALRSCAGSALLRDPSAVELMVRSVVDAARDVDGDGDGIVTAKIRAGYDDAECVEDLARAAEAGGAQLLTVHCRTRAEAYCDEVDWSRIARAVSAVSIPVCGNGGVNRHADLERMREETGCAFVMVGRAALGDPWIFTGREVTREAAARFLCDYASALGARENRSVRSPKAIAGRVKQLLQHWVAGGLVEDRSLWLKERDPARLLARLERIAEEGHSIAPALDL